MSARDSHTPLAMTPAIRIVFATAGITLTLVKTTTRSWAPSDVVSSSARGIGVHRMVLRNKDRLTPGASPGLTG